MNKNVVITGVSSGLGLATAQHLLARGYRIYGSVRTLEDAQRVGVKLRSGLFTPLLFDVTDHESIADAAKTLAENIDGDGIAGLINNAGVAPLGPLEYTSIQNVRDVFEVNVFGVLAVTQAFLPLLKAQAPDGKGEAGRIINISSTSGSMTFPMLGVYAASKYALESLNDGLRRELSRYGVKVIAIEPGPTRTDIWDKTRGDEESGGFANTEYAQIMSNMPAVFERQLENSKPVSKVTQAITTALEADKPRSRYPLDSAWYAGKHLPDGILDRIISREIPERQ